MALGAWVVRALLAAVFAAAGASKARNRKATADAARGFGVPGRVAGLSAVALPLVEFGVAAGLALPASARWAAAVAIGLLLLFSMLVGVALVRGRHVACHCFGSLNTKPAGVRTIARNAALLAAAAFVWFQPATGAADVLAGAEPGWVVGVIVATLLIAAVAFQAWWLQQLLAQQGRLMARVGVLEAAVAGDPVARDAAGTAAPRGLPVGAAAPAFALEAVDGSRRSLAELIARGRPVALVFSAPRCAACTVMLPDLARWQREHEARLTIAVVGAGSASGQRAKAARHGLRDVLADPDRDVAQAYRSHGTPAAVLVGTDGLIASELVLGPQAVRDLLIGLSPVVAAPRRPTHRIARGVGTPAPKIDLPDLEGRPTTIGAATAATGEETLLLFWNPDCGFCRKMVPDLKALEASQGGPRLVVISRGSVEANRETGLEGTTVLDDAGTAMQRYGIRGTPSAVLVDDRGRIVSAPAAGASAVLALARGDGLATASRRPAAAGE